MSGPNAPTVTLVREFDRDGNGWLNREEREAARARLKEVRAEGGERRRGGPPGMGGDIQSGSPGPSLSPDAVEPSSAPLFDLHTVRTLFLDFDTPDWLAEMGEFYGTDVEMPATLTVDGKRFEGVGVSYRGASSYFTVAESLKRSLSVSIDLVHDEQRLMGVKSLNLLNAHTDPSFMRTVLFFAIANRHLAAPRANFVRVVLNGECWGLFVSSEQFNKDLIADRFPSADGARWKVPGSPQGRGGLEYLGEDIDAYRSRYDIKSKDDEKSWRALIALCRTLNETPAEELEAKLAPMLDIESTLWFLALDCALVNNDGYWTRASDYNLFLDPKGVFHLLPHDANETFGMGGGGGPGRPGGPGGGPGPGGPGGPGGEGGPPDGERRGRGPNAEMVGQAGSADRPPERPQEGGRRGGGRRGPGGGGPTLDPLVGLDDQAKPLRSKLLAVPSLQRRYLEHVRTIARVDLDWASSAAPLVDRLRPTIRPMIEADTRKLATVEAFDRQFTMTPPPEQGGAAPEGAPRPRGTLRDFFEQRRAFLLNHPKIKALDETPG